MLCLCRYFRNDFLYQRPYDGRIKLRLPWRWPLNVIFTIRGRDKLAIRPEGGREKFIA